MKRQQIMPRNSSDYGILNIEISKKSRQIKEQWLKEKYAQIEIISIIDKVSMPKRIEELTGEMCILCILLINRMHKMKRRERQ